MDAPEGKFALLPAGQRHDSNDWFLPQNARHKSRVPRRPSGKVAIAK